MCVCLSAYKCVSATSAPGVKAAQTSCQAKHHVSSFHCQMNRGSSRQAETGWFGSGVRVRASILGNPMKVVTTSKGTKLYFNNCCDLCETTVVWMCHGCVRVSECLLNLKDIKHKKKHERQCNTKTPRNLNPLTSPDVYGKLMYVSTIQAAQKKDMTMPKSRHCCRLLF